MGKLTPLRLLRQTLRRTKSMVGRDRSPWVRGYVFEYAAMMEHLGAPLPVMRQR